MGPDKYHFTYKFIRIPYKSRKDPVSVARNTVFTYGNCCGAIIRAHIGQRNELICKFVLPTKRDGNL